MIQNLFSSVSLTGKCRRQGRSHRCRIRCQPCSCKESRKVSERFDETRPLTRRNVDRRRNTKLTQRRRYLHAAMKTSQITWWCCSGHTRRLTAVVATLARGREDLLEASGAVGNEGVSLVSGIGIVRTRVAKEEVVVVAKALVTVAELVSATEPVVDRSRERCAGRRTL